MIKKTLSIVAAATLAVGSLVLADPPAQPSMNSNSPALLPPNSVEREAMDISSTHGVQQAAAQLTQAGVSGNLKDIRQYVCQADQKRLESAIATQSPDQKLLHFRQDWHEKYGNEFSIPDAVAVFSDPNVQLLGGDVSDRARTAGERIPGDMNSGTTESSNAKSAAAAGSTSLGKDVGNASQANTENANSNSTANPIGSVSSGTMNTNGANAINSQNTIAGTNLADLGDGSAATLIFPADHDLPAVTARFVNESEQWKIDIPNNVDGKKIQQNLDDELGRLDDHKASWPTDPKQAQLAVAHAVLAAMTDARTISNTGVLNNPISH